MFRRTIFLSLLCSVAVFAGPCVVGSLNSYEQLGAAGCTVGALRYFNFTFSITDSAFENDNQILVTPVVDPVSPGLDFSQIFATTSASVTLSIDYSIDPPPIIVRQLLDGDPPTGNVIANESLCINQLFGGGANCADNSAPLQFQINNANPPNSLSNIFNFPVNESTLDTRTDLTLGPGPSGIDDLIERTTLAAPEPATFGIVGLTLLALAAFQYPWKKRANQYKRIAP